MAEQEQKQAEVGQKPQQDSDGATPEDYRDTFSSPQGKRVLRDLQNGFYHKSLFDEQAHGVQFNAGSHFVIVYIMTEMEKEMETDAHVSRAIR